MDRTPLSNKEYFALLAIFGANNCFRQRSEDITTRCSRLENGAERLNTAISILDGLLDDILDTVPLKKLLALREELKNTTYKLEVTKDFTGKAKEKGITYVPVDALEQLVMQVINDNCTFCDKSTAKSKQCRLLPIIEDCFPWDMPPKKDGCPLRGDMFTED